MLRSRTFFTSFASAATCGRLAYCLLSSCMFIAKSGAKVSKINETSKSEFQNPQELFLLRKSLRCLCMRIAKIILHFRHFLHLLKFLRCRECRKCRIKSANNNHIYNGKEFRRRAIRRLLGLLRAWNLHLNRHLGSRLKRFVPRPGIFVNRRFFPKRRRVLWKRHRVLQKRRRRKDCFYF